MSARESYSARLGEDDYRLLTNNCEHFCIWCLSGESRSEQVEALLHHPCRALLVIVGVLCSATRIVGQDLADVAA